ncbi:MAG TPA: PadR family transcriptional regulator [Bryobacteraceae bacterium]|nr:PadR family transcriptional regulator [Bryobacteraceae bacterium]
MAAQLHGTLDMIILRTLLRGPAHGHGITVLIQQVSEDALRVDHGSLYPALHRLEKRGWIASKWEDTDRGRQMRFYRLTKAGHKQLALEESNWHELVQAIGRILRPAEE